VDNVQTRAYIDGRLAAHDFPLADISDHLAGNAIVWVDFYRPTHEQLRELALELGLHELAVEDALEPHQRPKLDHYETHLFLACHALHVDPRSRHVERTEVNAFINAHWLVTVRKEDAFDTGRLTERWDRTAELASHGVGYLLYGLLDAVVDGYFDALEVFDEYYDEVSEGIFAEQPLAPLQQRDWFEMRQALVRFHRSVYPLREAVGSLLRREHGLITDDLLPYYQDVYDHVLRVSESTDALRELVATIVETNLSLRDYRQNLIMKKVTSWAAIIAVPTLITGYYGMNVPYPGAGELSGVFVSTTLALGLSGLLYTLFRRNDWL
jgi:magnesium transporter